MIRSLLPATGLLVALAASTAAQALTADRLRIQRQEVFAFTAKPSVVRDGDAVTITFAVREPCDATVAIENANGRILRHLACGVLGENAPEPFQKNSLKQRLVWDGKDEIGRYVDTKDACTVRVSLGLRARMERTLWWSGIKAAQATSPKHGGRHLLMAPAPDGVYVWYNGSTPQLILYDHGGGYVRTIYPFPAETVGRSPDECRIDGLGWRAYPPDGEKLPDKLLGHDQDTFLPDEDIGDLVVHGDRIWMVGVIAKYVGTDGSARLSGPVVAMKRGEDKRGRPIYAKPTAAACKSFRQTIKIDPQTGGLTVQPLPTDPEDMGFDWEGRAYLRTFNAITRFDSTTWREIPYDYGDKRTVNHGAGGGGEKPYRASSAITLPSTRGGMFHMGGFGVAPDGTVAVSCINPNKPGSDTRRSTKNAHGGQGGNAYLPPIYPGRTAGWETHLFDERGNLLRADAVPGIGVSNFLQIDRNHDVYILCASTPYIDGKRYFNGRGCTLMKVTPGKMKGLSVKGILPLPTTMRPKRPIDMTRPGIWAEGAEWLFGPVGADGHYGSGGKCSCYVNGRFDLDYFGRSFAPEIDRFRVVVLDRNGNAILRIGRYGNVDDGMPLVKPDPGRAGRPGWQPPSPRSIGADEVAIMHAQNLAVHTDNRLFLADVGNQCIRAVQLGYHATERVALRDAAQAD
jgi:hypothetical protein